MRDAVDVDALIVGVVLMVILLCACSPSSSHQTYSYHGPQGFDGRHFSGDQVLVQWKAQTDTLTTDSAPAQILLNVELIGGPFSTIDTTLKAIRESMATNNSFPKEAVVASSQPIQTDNLANKSFTSSLIIPAHLKSGYYDLFYTVTTTCPGKQSVVMRTDALFKIS